MNNGGVEVAPEMNNGGVEVAPVVEDYGWCWGLRRSWRF